MVKTGQIASGPAVGQFEGLLQTYLGNPCVTSTADVSSSITVALFMAGVRPGDEVVTTPMTCLATTAPVRNLFAEVRWCDVDPTTGNLDPEGLERSLSSRTRAILVFHWAGNPADVDSIRAIGSSWGIPVVEDAGEALGSEYKGRKIGNSGSDYTVFSFYPNRHINTIEGGAIAFGKETDYEQGRWLKRYGIHHPSFRTADGEIDPRSDIPVAGWNSYMNQVAASIGVAQMRHLPSIIERHHSNGLFYDAALAEIPGITTLKRLPQTRSAHWVYTFLSDDRTGLMARLRAEGIQASRVHIRNDIYSCFESAKQILPGVDFFDSHCLSIPCGWWLQQEDLHRIVDCIARKA
ncbi:MAG: DegT/DnrJ/EryC1/StrS family aminotransferase [Deltaproteobacteria bacterium]|nr:DegT/DnrJ/EryC1/StrS family aminotransferase [Deltaproteobacteria bacterium]